MSLQEQLATAMQGTVVVMGLGNPCRGDDAAGSLVARKVREVLGQNAIDAQDVPENYLCQVVDLQPDTVVLIDSVDLSAAPGTVALLDKEQMVAYWPGTHRVPISLLMNYLEQQTRARVMLIAIQPYQTSFLQAITPAVLSSVEAIAGALITAISSRSIVGQGTTAQDGFTSELRKVAP
jgi:hydrogenase 3 maturation protease